MKSILCLLLFISHRGVQEAQFTRHLKVSNLKEVKSPSYKPEVWSLKKWAFRRQGWSAISLPPDSVDSVS